MEIYKLGKREPRVDPRTLKLARYLTSALPPNPADCDQALKIPGWGMMLNDQLGDCTCACVGHMVQQWTGELNAGRQVVPPDSAVEKMYEAVGGYVPGDSSTDNGAAILDVLNYWRKTGILGAAPEAYLHKILGYAAVNNRNHSELQSAVYLFGNCYIGVQLPVTAQGEDRWVVPPGGWNSFNGPGSWGGHAIPIVAYFAPDTYVVVSWGSLIPVSAAFLDACCDEAYAVFSTDWLNSKGMTLDGFDRAALDADLMQFS